MINCKKKGNAFTYRIPSIWQRAKFLPDKMYTKKKSQNVRRGTYGSPDKMSSNTSSNTFYVLCISVNQPPFQSLSMNVNIYTVLRIDDLVYTDRSVYLWRILHGPMSINTTMEVGRSGGGREDIPERICTHSGQYKSIWIQISVFFFLSAQLSKYHVWDIEENGQRCPLKPVAAVISITEYQKFLKDYSMVSEKSRYCCNFLHVLRCFVGLGG